MESLKNIIKSISLEKWLLIGGAGIVLILCSDSCSKDTLKDTNEVTANNTEANDLESKKYIDYIEDNFKKGRGLFARLLK